MNTLVPHLRMFSASILAVLGLNLAATAAEWTEDFAAAKEQAAKEKKDLLMDFTGSDWCHFCIKLKEEVLSKPEFEAEAPKSFVLVEVDFPDKKKQDEKIKTQNKQLQKTYSIEGYPTVILADSTGRAYAKMGYAPGGPVPYMKQLSELRAVREKRDAAFEKAAKAEGLEKAKALHEGIKSLDSEIASTYYSKEMDEIAALDKDDTLGVKKGKEVAKASQALQQKLEALHGAKKFDEFAKELDNFIAEWKLEGLEKQRILIHKLAIYGPDKLDDAEKVTDELLKIDPKSEVGLMAVKIKEQIASMRTKGKDGDDQGKAGEKDKPEVKEEVAPKSEDL